MRTVFWGGLLAMSLVCAGCGDPAVEDSEPFEFASHLTFELDIDRAVEMGRVDPSWNRREIVNETIEIVRQRIEEAGAKARVRAAGETSFDVFVADALDNHAVIGLVTSLGSIAFRIEVLPEYEDHAGTDREREKVWDGTADEFDEFKRKQAEKWRSAAARGKPYRCDDMRYDLVLEASKDSSQDAHFHVVERPKPAFRFDGTMLARPAVGQDMRGNPTVNFEIKKDHQQAFETWTTENVGLPMAIIVNDEYFSAPYVMSPLRDNVQISLGMMTTVEAGEREAKELAAVLQFGALKVRPELRSVETTNDLEK